MATRQAKFDDPKDGEGMDVTEQRARSAQIRSGQMITRKETPGRRGKTGLAPDPHLHRVRGIPATYRILLPFPSLPLGRSSSRQCRLEPSLEGDGLERRWRPRRGGVVLYRKQRNPSFHGTVYRSGEGEVCLGGRGVNRFSRPRTMPERYSCPAPEYRSDLENSTRLE